jgi:hypothetical protein
VSYTPGQQSTRPTTPDGLARFVIAALLLPAAASIWLAVTRFDRASYLAGVLDKTVSFTESSAQHQDDRVGTAATLILLAILVAGVLFIVWLFRVVRQLHAGRPTMFRYRAGWAIGGWFVPLVNLVIPKQMVDDSWRAATDRAKPVPPLFHVWWAAYLLGGLVTIIGRGVENGDTTNPHSLVNGDRIGGAGSLISALAAVLAMVVVAKLDAAARQASPAPAPAPALAPALAPAGQWPPVTAPPPTVTFNPPPGWPVPPPGWTPPPGWQPDPAWPPAPEGWQFWVPINPS